MSYYHGGNYGRPPPPQLPPRQPYRDPYNNYQSAPNGGDPAQPAQPQYAPQYPGQPTYGGQYESGGPVQQPVGGYQQDNMNQSPRNPSFGAGYSPQQYSAPATYNPQQYAQTPPLSQGQMPQYNPSAYVNTAPSPYLSQHSSATFTDASAQATSGPLGETYGYTPSAYTNNSYSPQQARFPQSSPQVSSQQYSPQQPTSRQFQYQSQPASPPPPPHQYPYQVSTSSALQGQNLSYPDPDQYRQPLRQNSTRHANISPALPGLSDGQWRPSPPGHQLNEPGQSPSPLLYHTDSHSSLPSPPSSTPGPTPPAHGPSRSNTLDRHPHSRPLPGPPDLDSEADYFQNREDSRRSMHASEEEDEFDQDELFSQVESAVLNAGRAGRSPSISLTQAPYQGSHRPQPLFSPSPREGNVSPGGNSINGHLSPTPSHGTEQARYSDDSDAEAAAGLEAMRLADERDAEESRRQSGSSTMRFSGYNVQRSSSTSHQPGIGEASDSDDYAGVDMSLYGGGQDVQMSYGGTPYQLAAGGENGEAHSQPVSSQHSSVRRSHASQSSRGDYDYAMDNVRPFPPFNPDARVDTGGTGGNYEPTADGRRQSYDEGDEYVLTEGQLPERFPDEPPDIFYHPAAASYRPLPPPPPPHEVTAPLLRTDMRAQSALAPEGYGLNAQGQWVPRSASLVSRSDTPLVAQPLRSKTDAEERRQRQNYRNSGYSTYDVTPASASAIAMDLPSLPTKRFVPSKLGAVDFKKCEEPWALSSILQWLITVTTADQAAELREAAVKEALVALFTSKIPTMNIADAEGLSDRVVEDMYTAGTLKPTEEWVKIVQAPMSGVIFQLTASGCYAPTVHNHMLSGRCYSHHCQRTLKKVNLQAQPTRTQETWAEFYSLKKEDIEGKDKKEIERQNVLHEIVQTEDVYTEQMNVLRLLYRDPLLKSEPSIITPKRKEKFIKDVFGRVDAVKQANEDHLLPQLKYRQEEQGPWIVGFSDIFRQWIRKAKIAYIEYAGAFPGATFTVRQEMERNIHFAQFLDRTRNDKRSNKLGWDTYLKAPITRLQRYTLLLQAVLKNMKTDSEEKTNLAIAYDEVKAVTLECDSRVAEMQRKVDLADLNTKLVLRPGMQSAVELNLNHLGRELVHRGDLQRMGGNRFTWLDCHALLFDHYLVLAKTVAHRADQGGRMEKYDVSRLPIPMDLLMLESTNDPAMQKSSYVKGISTVTAVTGRTPTPSEHPALSRVHTSQSPGPGLQHANTGASASSIQTVTALDTGKDSDKILYPFRVKHLGRETYTLFAQTEQARRDWCNKIIEAKIKHAAALFAQHAEPFRLRVMADAAFVYDPFGITGNRSVVTKGTPLDRAIKEVELRFKDTGRPGPICRARVNCATTFTTPYPTAKQMIAVGTDFGIFVSEVDNPRGWERSIQLTKVTQIAVLEEFSLFLLISDKSLIAYHLDAVCPTDRNGPASTTDSSRKAPQKLSGSRDVGFFVTGKMKDRTLVFYKKRENLSSTFKVLEPVYQKSTERKRGMALFKRGNTEFFREYDEFYIPTECTGINLFHSSLAVSTARGFEVLTLDKKQSSSVPNLGEEAVQNIARHLKDQKALSMLRLSDQEFLLVFANCAVYINKHGDISRSVIMEFVGTAQSVALHGAYLVLFDTDFVEIRNAQNGRLKQIIAGREIKCLDDGSNYGAAAAGSANGYVKGGGPPQRTVKVVMQHPELERTQIVVELLLNEGMKE